MKKIIGMAMLAIFIVGMMPLAFAEDADAEADAVMSGNGRGRGKGKMGQMASNIQARYLKAKSKYQAAVATHLANRAKFNAARSEYAACKGDDSEECEETRRNAKGNAKKVLMNTADRVVAMLEKLKARIDASDMSDEDKAERTERIDAKIAEIEEAGGSVENLDNESSTQEVKDAAKEIKKAWLGTKNVMKVSAARVLNNRIGGIVVQMEKVSEKLDRIMTKLEEKGYDTSAAADLIAEYEAELESAKQNFEDAQQTFASVDEADDSEVRSTLRKGHNYMKDAKKDLKDARQKLRQAVRAIRATGNGDSAIDDEEDEEESEDEEEDEEESEDEEETETDDEETGDNETVVDGQTGGDNETVVDDSTADDNQTAEGNQTSE